MNSVSILAAWICRFQSFKILFAVLHIFQSSLFSRNAIWKIHCTLRLRFEARRFCDSLSTQIWGLMKAMQRRRRDACLKLLVMAYYVARGIYETSKIQISLETRIRNECKKAFHKPTYLPQERLINWSNRYIVRRRPHFWPIPPRSFSSRMNELWWAVKTRWTGGKGRERCGIKFHTCPHQQCEDKRPRRRWFLIGRLGQNKLFGRRFGTEETLLLYSPTPPQTSPFS